MTRRIRWWWFLLRYRVARWRGKVLAAGMLDPRFIFEYRERMHTFGPELDWLLGRHPGDARVESTDAPAAPTDCGYFNAGDPRPRIWDHPHDR